MDIHKLGTNVYEPIIGMQSLRGLLNALCPLQISQVFQLPHLKLVPGIGYLSCYGLPFPGYCNMT